MEYSFLTLARCRPESGFSDVSTYDELKANHDEVISDVSQWREYARYYGIKLPAKLSESVDSTGAGESQGTLPETAASEAEPNGHRAEPNVVGGRP